MKKIAISLLILLAVCCFFFWPIFKGWLPFPGDLLVNDNPYRSLSIDGYSPNAYPNKAQGNDVIAEMYPWRYFSVNQMKQGIIPFWDPYNFSGNILMQNLQSSVFNPWTVVFYLLPFTSGWTIFIFLQPVLAALFLYLLLRQLKISYFPAILGSIGFAFSSYMTVWIEYGNIAATFLYLPLLLFFLIRFFEKEKVRDYAGFIIAAACMLLSGYIQGAFYSYVVLFLFTLFYFFSQKKLPTKKVFLSLIGMYIFPLFLVLFQYLPTVQVFSQSTRWPYSVKQFEMMLQPMWYWVTLFASDFFGNPASRNYYLATTYIERVDYVGIPFLFFAVYAFFQRKKYTWFFAGLAILVFFLTTNFPGVAYLYRLLPIPVIDTTVPTRFLSVFMFCLVILGVFGIDSFFRKKEFPVKLVTFFSSVYVLLWIGVFVAKKIYPAYLPQILITEHNLILPTLLMIGVILVVLLVRKFTRVAQVILFLLVVVDLFYVFQKITPFAPKETIYPQTPVMTYIQKNAGINRFWGYGSGYIEPNFQTVDMTYSPEGNDPLHFKNYGTLLATSYNGEIPMLPPRPDANIAPGYGTSGMQNPYRQKLLNLLGVKYILQNDSSVQNNAGDSLTFPSDTFQLVWSQNPWQIYENKQVLPRYFLANNFVVAKGEYALDLLYGRSNVSKTVILSTSPKQRIDKNARGSVQLLSYKTQKIIFTTKTTGTMLLFLSDGYYASWQAAVDGKQTPIYLADYAFRAVEVPAGKHTVTMYYQAWTFTLGLEIACGAFVLFLISLLFLMKYENKK